ncbi:glycosyltransferase, group 2 family protein [Clostridium botulinum B str. Osaka05]|uniref:Glycosyltransferase, group 2 family protein n=1 Tax=Clostridium botulinum B str. Osaka05 TaxID=1407017 RepID=A0A060N8K7_CLOBO|nr:hypothetical protein [Clostridium botulinum]BAO04773.1 glycosyltransferase, group 2 family protein [Clostridium botulinum B str. Osaka05]
MENPFLNGIVTIFGLIYYLNLCIDIQKEWTIYKKEKNYQGLYIGDIIVSIITLPLILIETIIKLLKELEKGVAELMNVKIK